MIRRLVPLFSVAASLALSGCYIDHRPNPTFEERLSADDSERRKMGGVKVRPVSLAEFADVTRTSPDAVAFDLKLDDDESYAFFLITKTLDPKSGKRDVKAGFQRMMPGRDGDGAGRPALVAVFSGTKLLNGVRAGSGYPSTVPVTSELPVDLSGASVDAGATGDNLPVIGDAVRRFVVRKAVARDGTLVEIECDIVPSDKTKDSGVFVALVAGEWSKAK